MEIIAGQTIIHPHHGPATVDEVITRQVRGVATQYLRLTVHQTNLSVGVPVAKAEEIGLRPVIGREELAAILDVLRAPSGEADPTWSRRYKDHQDKLRLGDLRVTAGVVRDLMRRLRDHGLSLGEKDQLREATGPLVAEVALALDITEGEAESVLEAAVLQVDSIPA